MTARPAAQQRAEYERGGILFPLRVCSASEAADYRRALERVAAQCEAGARKRFANLHLHFEWAYRLVTHDALLDAVEELLGGELLIDGTLVFSKPPHDAGYASWHQDSVYSGWHLTPSVSAWIALTPSYAANGCMRVLPGSHRQGLLAHTNAPDAQNLVRRGERVATEVDEARAVDVVLQPGEMSLHHSNIIHGSNANASDEPRTGFIARFVTDRIENRERPLLRVRGAADCRHLMLASSPPAEADEQTAFAAWRASSQP